MKISLSWAQDNANVNLKPGTIDDLVTRIGAQLGAVEEVIDYGKRFDGVLVVKVISCQKIADSDKLSLCLVDDGGAAQNVTRQEDGLVQVVCGAPNVREGLLAAWLPPGSTVPSTIGKAPFVLEARPIRGHTSNGMLASPKELGLSENHDGILEIDLDARPGQPFAELYGLDDTIIDVENKMFTHRPDCFGIIGVARELAGIQGLGFTSPDWYLQAPDFAAAGPEDPASALPLQVRNEAPDLVPRFMAVPVNNITVAPSPVWMQSHLTRVGIKPINNVVDITNYLMYLTGQPLHAYDYDKVKAQGDSDNAVLVARRATATDSQGEPLVLLGGKSIEAHAPSIVIATDRQAIGLGGVMGGAETEVDANTKRVILECATFDMYSIRKTAMQHGLFTDAVTRFNKGQSPLQNDRVVAKALELLNELAGGSVAGMVQDLSEKLPLPASVPITPGFINERLGLDLRSDQILGLLQNVEFTGSVNEENGELTITAPFWRTDIAIPEDIVEEVGRLYGFDHLPKDLPFKDLTPAARNPRLELKQQIRQRLANAGANEVLTYSFVHGKLLETAGQPADQAFHVRNAISPDLQYYRLSLTPSLLEKVHPNLKADLIRPTDDNELAIFEMNPVHSKTELGEDGLPAERARLALVVAADDKTARRKYHGAPYFEARRYADYLLEAFGIQVQFQPWDEQLLAGHDLTKQMAAPYEFSRSGMLVQDSRVVGVVGEFRADVRKRLKLPAFAAGLEIFLSVFEDVPAKGYQPLPKFPRTQQDISFKVPSALRHGPFTEYLEQTLEAAALLHGHAVRLEPLDIYRREGEDAHVQYAYRIWLHNQERTLTTEEVNNLLDELAGTTHRKFQAERL